MDAGEAFRLINRAIECGKPAHGYLLVGDANITEALVDRILRRLFPEEVVQIASKSHPDVAWLEPEGKKRIIKIDSMRDKIVVPMMATAFSGGWKVGVISGADRMEPPSANAFLKSLEEPTPKTMYLMTTDAPDSILPTIISRSQRIDLPLSEGLVDEEVEAEMRAAMMAKDAAKLAEILEGMRDGVEDDEAMVNIKRFFKTLIAFARRIMLGGKVARFLAFRNIELIERAYVQVCERSMGAEMVLSFMLDWMVLPK